MGFDKVNWAIEAMHRRLGTPAVYNLGVWWRLEIY